MRWQRKSTRMSYNRTKVLYSTFTYLATSLQLTEATLLVNTCVCTPILHLPGRIKAIEELEQDFLDGLLPIPDLDFTSTTLNF